MNYSVLFLILRGLDGLFNLLLLTLVRTMFTLSTTWHHNISLIVRVDSNKTMNKTTGFLLASTRGTDILQALSIHDQNHSGAQD